MNKDTPQQAGFKPTKEYLDSLISARHLDGSLERGHGSSSARTNATERILNATEIRSPWSTPPGRRLRIL